jgi:hypothetical protein
MRTKHLITAFIAFTALFIWSCKKDTGTPLEESPFFSFFDEANIQIDTTPAALSTWEYGFTFTPLKDGKVTKFGVKLPATGDFTVRLWDLSGATPTVVRERTVTSSALHNPAFIMVPDISVEKGKKYGITVLANSFYRITKKNGEKFAFPIERENIRIESFNEATNGSGTAAFPLTTTDDHVAPCVNVIFIAD